MKKPNSLWDKIDAAAALSRTETSQPAAPSEKIRLPAIWVLDLIAVPLWLYLLVDIFVFDVDDYFFERVLGLNWNPADYRFLFFLGVLVALVLFARKYWFVIGYIMFFPLVVLFWKLPRLIYRTRSWLFLFVVINLVANLLRNFKYVAVTVATSTLCLFAALFFNVPALQIGAVVGLLLFLLVAYYRTIRSSFTASRFIEGQRTVIHRVTDSNLVWQLAQVDENLKRPDIEHFDDSQLNTFLGKVSTGLLIHRGLYFWAYQLDRYRESPAPSFFNSIAYAWLFFISVMTFWMANLVLLKVDPSGFEFSRYPSNFLVLLYSLRTFTLGGLNSLEPVGNWQTAVAIAAGVTGVLLLTTLVANLIFGARARRQSEAIRQSVEELKERARVFEEKLNQEYQVPIAEAFRRLEELGRGFVSWVAYLTAKIPPDFFNNSE